MGPCTSWSASRSPLTVTVAFHVTPWLDTIFLPSCSLTTGLKQLDKGELLLQYPESRGLSWLLEASHSEGCPVPCSNPRVCGLCPRSHHFHFILADESTPPECCSLERVSPKGSPDPTLMLRLPLFLGSQSFLGLMLPLVVTPRTSQTSQTSLPLEPQGLNLLAQTPTPDSRGIPRCSPKVLVPQQLCRPGGWGYLTLPYSRTGYITPSGW